MSQHDYDIANAGGAAVRADLNNVLAAIKSNNAGVSAPSVTTPGMFWLDTPGSGDYTLKVRDKGDNHWLTIGTVHDPGADADMSLVSSGAAPTIVKFASTAFNPAAITNTVITFQSTPVFTVFQKTSVSNRIYVLLHGGHNFCSGSFPNATRATICQTSDTSTFTPTTTYATGDDPASGGDCMMERYCDISSIISGPWIIGWYFPSSGQEWEGFRVFHRARIASRNAVFHENANYFIHLTLFEIAV